PGIPVTPRTTATASALALDSASLPRCRTPHRPKCEVDDPPRSPPVFPGAARSRRSPPMPRIDGSLATPLADRRRGREMVRLMVATNTIDSLARPLMLAVDEGYAEEFGQTVARGVRVVMLALLVNTLKEA